LAAAASFLPPERRGEADTVRILAAAAVVYLGSALVVDVAGAHTGNTTQNSQLALSAFWAALGFTSLVTGLARDKRPLRPAELVPDGSLYAHARRDFSDLRVFDPRGVQVPWRQAPASISPGERAVEVLDSGRRGGVAVARIDLGPQHGVIEHVTLQVPDSRFV